MLAVHPIALRAVDMFLDLDVHKLSPEPKRSFKALCRDQMWVVFVRTGYAVLLWWTLWILWNFSCLTDVDARNRSRGSVGKYRYLSADDYRRLSLIEDFQGSYFGSHYQAGLRRSRLRLRQKNNLPYDTDSRMKPLRKLQRPHYLCGA
jgi:hypothetical protein